MCILQQRPIPSSGEHLPVVGLGTWQAFDQSPDAEGATHLPHILRQLMDAGARVVDTSPMYGLAERTIGTLIKRHQLPAPFLATKVWTRGKAEGQRQMQQSLQLLQCTTVDLMQIHNLVDWQTHLPTLYDWKAEGRLRYIGITHYTEQAYPDLEAVLRQHRVDFLQINYSLGHRKAAERLLPLAADHGVAVLINRPLEEGLLLRKVQALPLPGWASELGCTTWSTLLLKYILANPAVTCVIPATQHVGHLHENLQAGVGAWPDAAQCAALERLIA